MTLSNALLKACRDLSIFNCSSSEALAPIASTKLPIVDDIVENALNPDFVPDDSSTPALFKISMDPLAKVKPVVKPLKAPTKP